jgi:RHS repeat-associated protein
MLGKSFESGLDSGYRFGFNGKEDDNETYGDGNEVDFGARIYDGRLGRWMSVDPLSSKFVSYSPFTFGLNSPIIVIDQDGLENIIYLVLLPSANGEFNKTDAEAIIAKSNSSFKALGILPVLIYFFILSIFSFV